MPEIADCVQIRGLRIVTFCGVLSQEQDERQPFRFDIDIYTDLRRAGTTDELTDTVNYGAVADDLAARLADERFLLVERMAQRAADLVLARELVDEVTVTVAKLRPPIAVDVDTTGVRIHRRRAEAE